MKLTLPWNRPKDNYLVLVGSILIAQSAGLIGSLFTVSAIKNWYIYLNKPFFSPPNWVFAPVWTLLYTLMGIAAYLVWRKYQFGKKARSFWHVYATQLILNALWSILFFGLKHPLLALIEILAMWYFIARSMQEGQKLSKWSLLLWAPYLTWVTFAAALNGMIVILN